MIGEERSGLLLNSASWTRQVAEDLFGQARTSMVCTCKPSLSGYLVFLVHLAYSTKQTRQTDRPNEQDRLADFLSIPLDVGFFLLLRSLVGFHFDLLHGVLEASPFFRSHRLKLKAELPPSAPPN